MEIKFDNSDKFDNLFPEIVKIEDNETDYPMNWWKIDQTISELAYLSHGFFRYYGKFPPTIVSYLINRFPCPKNGCLLDNFSGSGTSLVEAARKGIPSIGIDINPLACLAGKVKTTLYDVKKLKNDTRIIKQKFADKNFPTDYELAPDKDFLNKWFFSENVDDITRIKTIILSLNNEIEIEFFSLAFFAVIRRLSKAYDGEVRPHLNTNKKVKDPLTFFLKKIDEMVSVVNDLHNDYPNTIQAQTILTDTRSDYSAHLPSKHYWLVVSHPPYLNCFDYIPVFNLEFKWCEKGFDFLWNGNDIKSIKQMELKSWPAKDELINSYYEGLNDSYRIIHKIQEKGDKLAIVIGDCTIQKVLEPVHRKLIKIVEAIGYRVIELNYRTTSYTTGAYAYQARADYNSSEKRDAIIIFEKK